MSEGDRLDALARGRATQAANRAAAAAASPETQPARRRPGRPPGSKNVKTNTRARTRKESAPKVDRPTPRERPLTDREITATCALAVGLLDGVAGVVFDWHHIIIRDAATGEPLDVEPNLDRLSPAEAGALTRAIANEVRTHARLRAIVKQVRRIGTHGELALVAAAIAAPRLARRGLLPEELGALVVSMAAAGGGMSEDESWGADATSPVGTGPAHGGDRDGGLGEVNGSQPYPASAPLVGSLAEQT